MEQITTPVSGIILQPLAIISTNGGAVLKCLQPGNPLLPDFTGGFGELYFSEIQPGIIRAWKKHKIQQQLFCVPSGLVRLGFFDDRINSPSCGNAFAIALGRPHAWCLLHVPCGIWYGFEGMANEKSLICNLASCPHDAAEIIRAPDSGGDSPFQWQNLTQWQWVSQLPG